MPMQVANLQHEETPDKDVTSFEIKPRQLEQTESNAVTKRVDENEKLKNFKGKVGMDELTDSGRMIAKEKEIHLEGIHNPILVYEIDQDSSSKELRRNSTTMNLA